MMCGVLAAFQCILAGDPTAFAIMICHRIFRRQDGMRYLSHISRDMGTRETQTIEDLAQSVIYPQLGEVPQEHEVANWLHDFASSPGGTCIIPPPFRTNY